MQTWVASRFCGPHILDGKPGSNPDGQICNSSAMCT
jgi:hypothetical protein